jgi:hypothetical protein
MIASTTPDRWIDRWGHWVFWMGPFILITSLLSWTPRLVLLLAGVELFQFTLHVREHHPTHPLTPVSALFISVATAMYLVGLLFYPIAAWAYLFMVCQIVFSKMVHDSNHGTGLGRFVLVGVGLGLLLWPILLTMQGVVPGLPLLRPYLILG